MEDKNKPSSSPAPQPADLKALQILCKEYGELNVTLSKVRAILKEKEDVLKNKALVICKGLIDNKLPELTIGGTGKFKPKIKTNWYYPSSGKPSDRKAFLEFINDAKHFGKGYSDNLLEIKYTTVNKIFQAALDNEWIKKGEKMPGVNASKTSFGVSFTKK